MKEQLLPILRPSILFTEQFDDGTIDEPYTFDIPVEESYLDTIEIDRLSEMGLLIDYYEGYIDDLYPDPKLQQKD